ncbi:peptidase S9A, prolyl oligopeptidase [Artemisia annua]|uniref:Peptidase S9A, prolyl oligopeptidase n=1 Tax=Artemisia annua TaxID=35608 RepID=A0A2U1LQ16_ARTAN|nr:peptidase S9A, prolyl oligopeptidase [Artemisia annua]
MGVHRVKTGQKKLAEQKRCKPVWSTSLRTSKKEYKPKNHLSQGPVVPQLLFSIALCGFWDSLDEEREIFLDPDELSEDGTTALRAFEVSHDAEILGLRLMRVDDKSVEPDKLSWVKFYFISWTHHTKRFFYCRFAAPKGSENMNPGGSEHQPSSSALLPFFGNKTIGRYIMLE